MMLFKKYPLEACGAKMILMTSGHKWKHGIWECVEQELRKVAAFQVLELVLHRATILKCVSVPFLQ